MEALKTVFMGTPDFAATILRYLVANEQDITGVYTQRDTVSGRGQVLVPSAVKRAALEVGITVIQPRNFRSEETVADLSRLRPDLIVVAAYGQILPQAVLDIPRFGCLNVHPSLLPRFRGVSPVAAAILAGDEFTGVTVMLLDAGTDTGPILAQAQVPVHPHDTTGSLSDKLALIGAQLLLDVAPLWAKGAIAARPQDEARASYCKKLTKEDGKIDWALPAADIWRRVRAFHPWPGAFTAWQGRQIKILAARPFPEAAPVTPGQVIELHDTVAGLGIGTGRGVLGVLTLQLEGKKIMPAGDFLRGQRSILGATLG